MKTLIMIFIYKYKTTSKQALVIFTIIPMIGRIRANVESCQPKLLTREKILSRLSDAHHKVPHQKT